MALYSFNTAQTQIYSLNYFIVYSVEYIQHYTVTYFSNSTFIGVWAVIFMCMTPCGLVYFSQPSAPFFRMLMTTYRNALFHNPEDENSKNYQSTNSNFNLIWTNFIKYNEPPNAYQQNVFHHILLFTDIF